MAGLCWAAWGAVPQGLSQVPQPWPPIREPLTQHLGEIIALQPSDRKLKIEICSGLQPGMEAARQIANGRGSSGSGGGSFWMAASWGESAAILAGRGDPFRSNENLPLRVQYTDLGADGSRLDLLASEEGAVSMLAFARNTPHFLYFEQLESGAVRTAILRPQDFESARATSFGDLLDQQPFLTSDWLLPQLNRWGVCRVSGKKSQAIRDLTLLLFEPQTEDPEFAQAIENLNSSKFEEREKATEWLLARAPNRLPQILTVLQRSDTPSEVLSRLRKVLKLTLPEADYLSFEFLDSQKLASDPEYLIWLVEQISAVGPLPAWLSDQGRRADTAAHLYARLRQLTQQDLPDDIASWRTWYSTQRPSTTSAAAMVELESQPLQLGEPPAELTRWSDELRQLLPLAVIQGRLQLDREAWRRLFGGKTIPELLAETRDFLEQRHLPGNWLSVRKEDEAILDYPQILFRRMESLMEGEPVDDQFRMRRLQRQMMNPGGPTRNHRLLTPNWGGTLELEEGQFVDVYHRTQQQTEAKGPEERGFFLLEFQGNTAVPWRMLTGCWPDGSLRIVVITADDLVQIFQANDGKCWLAVTGKQGVYVRTFGSADSLVADPDFVHIVSPFLRQIGVVVGPDR